jgi:hypothetical protein
VSIREKMYPNLFIDSTVKDLLAGIDPVRLINEYNDGWVAVSNDERLGNDAAIEGEDEAPAPAPAGAPAHVVPLAPATAFVPVPTHVPTTNVHLVRHARYNLHYRRACSP